jgi:transglutaminase-like putative cysteine protease
VRWTIEHRTTYRYPTPVWESHTVLHLQPRSDLTQYCTRFALEITPRAPLFTYTDRFGNDVQHFSVLPRHDTLEVVARSQVVTARGDVQPPSAMSRRMIDDDPLRDDLYDFLHESIYVKFSPALDAYMSTIGSLGPDDDAAGWFRAAAAAIHRDFIYDGEATSVRTTVEESVTLRRGVCQDFAHVLVALCRRAGIPARYVSGYIHAGGNSEVLGAEASHAWAEAYLGPHGWVGLDPTNDVLIGDAFVRIGVGRDYRDVSPVRGVYKGADSGTLSVGVAMEAVGTPQAQAQQQQQ